MSKKQSIIRGTVILTVTGLITRAMGFFYRIFLSRTFGEEGVGLYQLIFPIYTLCYSLTTAGVETAVSRTTARKIALGKKEEALQVLGTGLLLTVTLSFMCLMILQKNAAFIAEFFLNEPRCRPLLIALSWSLPFSAVHSCICGYCYGIQQAEIPAATQLVEQIARISSVILLYFVIIKDGGNVSVALAVWGLAAGEIASATHAIYSLYRTAPAVPQKKIRISEIRNTLTELLSLSMPLTGNRVLINILQSVEAVNIPVKLEAHRMASSDALSMYGVLNGMALLCILFPSAVTGSVALMLLPAVADIQASGSRKQLMEIIKKTTAACFIMGMACCLGFLMTGMWIGETIFNSTLAGKFIVTLAWICPFLYTNTTFTSTINGLGKTGRTFFINASGLLVRIAGVFFAIPRYGIDGYLRGLLVSQLLVSILSLTVIYRSVCKN